MKVLITGSNGFIGKSLSVNLNMRSEIELLLFDLPQTIDDLRELVQKADFVFHLAGVNRPEHIDEFNSGNVDLTRTLLGLLEDEKRIIPIVLSSSTQAELDNPYGRSKKNAEDLVFAYAKRNNTTVYIYRFPNVFGKWCKPNYNSVVATFCHNAANQIPLRIDDPDKELTLVYIDDIVDEFVSIIDGRISPNIDATLSISPNYNITLGNLADIINGFSDSRRTLTLDVNSSDQLTKKLYATYLSYISPDDVVIPTDMKQDDRGFFSELIKSPHFGQISMSRTKPGVIRGNHWHNTKTEKFIVVEGKAVIRQRKIGTSEIFEYAVSGDEIRIIDIPPGYTHSMENIGENDVVTIFWAGEIFDPNNPDTFYENV